MKVKYESKQIGKMTITKIFTPIGNFEGLAFFNDEKDPFEPSKIVGSTISECRAENNFFKAQIKDKKAQLKGLSRAGITTGKVVECIKKEISDLQRYINENDDAIDYWIHSREKYIESRSTTKEEKEKFKEMIKQSFEDLSKIKTGQI